MIYTTSVQLWENSAVIDLNTVLQSYLGHLGFQSGRVYLTEMNFKGWRWKRIPRILPNKSAGKLVEYARILWIHDPSTRRPNPHYHYMC